MRERFRKIVRLAMVLAIGACSLAAQAGDFVIVLDPGHGGNDIGAPGCGSCEKDVTLSVTNKVGSILAKRIPSAKICYTRTGDTTIKPNTRASVANQRGGSIMVSIHCNSHDTDTSLAGGCVLVPDHKVKSIPDASAKLNSSNALANKILLRLSNDAGRRNRGIIKRGDLPVLTATNMPAVLVEMDYINNPRQCSYLNSASGQQQLAQAIAEGVIDYAVSVGVTVNKRGKGKTQTTTAEPDNNGGKGSKSETAAEPSGPIVYKIQFLLSPTPLPDGSPKLKGLAPVDYYQDGGYCKYTYGEYSTEREACKKLKEIKNLFKDAFIIRTRDGVRIK